MKSPVLIASSFIIFVAGFLLCWFNGRGDILNTTVITVGVAFLIGGLINLIGITVERRRKKINSLLSAVSWVSGIGGLILGAFLVIFPEVIIPYVVYLFGIVLVAGGLTLVCAMTWGSEGVRYPGWYYVLPVLILIDGIIIVSNDAIYTNYPLLVILTGGGFMAFGFSAILNMFTLSGKRRKANKMARAAEDAAKAEPIADPEPTVSEENNNRES